MSQFVKVCTYVHMSIINAPPHCTGPLSSVQIWLRIWPDLTWWAALLKRTSTSFYLSLSCRGHQIYRFHGYMWAIIILCSYESSLLSVLSHLWCFRVHDLSYFGSQAYNNIWSTRTLLRLTDPKTQCLTSYIFWLDRRATTLLDFQLFLGSC